MAELSSPGNARAWSSAPSLDQVLAFCARGPRRARLPRGRRAARPRPLRRAARRRDARPRSATSARTSSLRARAAGPSPSWPRASRPRMLIGEEQAVDRALGGRARRTSRRRARTGRASRSTCSTTPPAGESGLRAATLADLDVLVRACGGRPPRGGRHRRLRADPALFEWRTRAQIEEGRSWLWRRTARSSSRRRPRRGRRTPYSCSRSGSTRAARTRLRQARACADLCRLCSSGRRRVCLFVRPENAPRDPLYEAIGMRRDDHVPLADLRVVPIATQHPETGDGAAGLSRR